MPIISGTLAALAAGKLALAGAAGTAGLLGAGGTAAAAGATAAGGAFREAGRGVEEGSGRGRLAGLRVQERRNVRSGRRENRRGSGSSTMVLRGAAWPPEPRQLHRCA